MSDTSLTAHEARKIFEEYIDGENSPYVEKAMQCVFSVIKDSARRGHTSESFRFESHKNYSRYGLCYGDDSYVSMEVFVKKMQYLGYTVELEDNEDAYTSRYVTVSW